MNLLVQMLASHSTLATLLTTYAPAFDISVCLKHNTGCWVEIPLTGLCSMKSYGNANVMYGEAASSCYCIFSCIYSVKWNIKPCVPVCACHRVSHKFHSLDCTNFMGVWCFLLLLKSRLSPNSNRFRRIISKCQFSVYRKRQRSRSSTKKWTHRTCSLLFHDEGPSNDTRFTFYLNVNFRD